QTAIHHHLIAGLERGDAVANRRDLAGRLGADDQWQPALGERHAAEAPKVEMIECHRLDGDLHLAGGRRGRRRHLGKLELAVADQLKRANGGGHAGSRPITSATFCPPKPKELEMAWRTLASRAWFGTTSSGIVGSGTW